MYDEMKLVASVGRFQSVQAENKIKATNTAVIMSVVGAMAIMASVYFPGR